MAGGRTVLVVCAVLAVCHAVSAADGVRNEGVLGLIRRFDKGGEKAKFPGGEDRILTGELTGKLTPAEYARKFRENGQGIYVKPRMAIRKVSFATLRAAAKSAEGTKETATDGDLDAANARPAAEVEVTGRAEAEGRPAGRRRHLRPNRVARRPAAEAEVATDSPQDATRPGVGATPAPAGGSKIMVDAAWGPMEGASGYVYKGVYEGTTVALKIPKAENLHAEKRAAHDDPALAAARDGLLMQDGVSTGAGKAAFVAVATEYVMECEFVRQLSQSSDGEVGAQYMISGVGPVCVLVSGADIPTSDALSGEISVARADFFELYGDDLAADVAAPDPHTRLHDKATGVAEDLFEKNLLPVILLEFASHGAMPAWTEPEHEEQLEAMSPRGNAYDGLRVAYAQLWKAVAFMAAGNDDAGRTGFVHRDLKADNVMIHAGADGRPVVKIADLGMGYLSGHSAGLDRRGRARRDKDLMNKYEDQFCGTPGFFPPEVAMIIADHEIPGSNFADRMVEGLGFGYNGLWEGSSDRSERRTSLIADDSHPVARSARDSFTVALMLAFTLYNRALNEGDAMDRFVELSRLRQQGLVGFRAATAHSAMGCDNGQRYYHEHNEPWWAFIEAKFGKESRLMQFLKLALVCNIRDRAPPLTLAHKIDGTELNLEGCPDGGSALCTELLHYTTQGEPHYEFPSSSESESGSVIEYIEESISGSFSGGSVVIHDVEESDEPSFHLSLGGRETDGGNRDNRASFPFGDESAEDASSEDGV